MKFIIVIVIIDAAELLLFVTSIQASTLTLYLFLQSSTFVGFKSSSHPIISLSAVSEVLRSYCLLIRSFISVSADRVTLYIPQYAAFRHLMLCK